MEYLSSIQILFKAYFIYEFNKIQLIPNYLYIIDKLDYKS